MQSMSNEMETNKEQFSIVLTNKIKAKEFLRQFSTRALDDIATKLHEDKKLRPFAIMAKPFFPRILRELESLSDEDAFQFCLFIQEKALGLAEVISEKVIE